LHQRIFLAVDRDLVLGLDRGAGDELEVVGHVLEHDFTVFGVDAFFHFFLWIVSVANQHFVGPWCFATRLPITCRWVKTRDYTSSSLQMCKKIMDLRRHQPPRRIISKNSALVLVARILSRMNSIASISSMPYRSLRRIQMFCN